jgi:DNA (cytosine-5)-methyltransferase 1
MNELHLFAGAGGGVLGGILCGHTTVCAVEIEPYCRKVLLQRQRDGILPRFPIWDDVQTFDGKPWRGHVDIVCGGFPCQDISAAGKGAGIEGARSSMWKHMARIIGEIRPQYAFVENSPLLVGRGLATVLADLAEMGYDAKWCVLGAVDAGAPHRRDRIWILATDSALSRCEKNEFVGNESKIPMPGSNCNVPDSNLRGCNDGRNSKRQYETDNTQIGETQKDNQPGNIGQHWTSASDCDVANTTIERQPRQGQHWFGSDPAEAREGETDHAFAERVGHIWGIESPLGRVAHGVASRVDRLKAIGNGQVPAVAALAWKTLTNGIDH